MNDTARPSVARKGPPLSVLLSISLLAASAAVALTRGARATDTEVIVERIPPGTATPDINLGLVGDAATAAEPRIGRRYLARMVEASRTSPDAVARIGGRVTFVAGARPGETRVVEVTAVRATVAEAVAVGPPQAAPSDAVPAAAQTYTGAVEGVGTRGDGRVTVEGLPVYVPGAAKGERIVFEIVRRSDRYGTGRLIAKLPTEPADGRPDVGADGLVTGVVEGIGSRGDGRVIVDGLPVYVPGTAVGDRIVFAVERRTDRYGTGRLVEKLSAGGGPPVELKVGDILEVTITERSRRNPEREGVARIGGRALIVPGVASGQTVRVRISEVRERVAFGEVAPASPPAEASP